MRNFNRFKILGFLICIVAMLLTTEVSAMDNRSQAIAYYNMAITAWNSQNYEEAISNFSMAYYAYGYRDFNYNIAVCYDLLEKYDAALFNYNEYLKLNPNGHIADFVRKRINVIVNAPTTRVWGQVGGMGDAPPQYGWVTVRKPPPETFTLYNQDWMQ